MSRISDENVTLTISSLNSRLKRLLGQYRSHSNTVNVRVDLNQMGAEELSNFYQHMLEIQIAINELLKTENPHPKTIRALIYDCYRVIANIPNIHGISSEIINSCVTTSIELIRTMGTINYFNQYYSANNGDNNYGNLKDRMHELANIISAIGQFTEMEKLPRTVDLDSLLLPLIKQFKAVAERIMSINWVQSNKIAMNGITLSFSGFFYGVYQLSTSQYLIFSKEIELMINRCYHSLNNGNEVSNSLRSLSALISYLETKNSLAVSQQPLSVRVGVLKQPQPTTVRVGVLKQPPAATADVVGIQPPVTVRVDVRQQSQPTTTVRVGIPPQAAFFSTSSPNRTQGGNSSIVNGGVSPGGATTPGSNTWK